MTSIALLLGSLLLVAACGVFVAAEFALIAADRATVERLAESGDRRSRGVLTALRSLSTQLSGVQLGITLTNLAIGFLAEPAVADLLHGPLGAAGLSDGAAEGVALTIALVASTVVTMLFGELVPKNFAIAKPVETARAVEALVRGFTTVMAWPIRLLNGTANLVLHAFGLEAKEELASARSAEELASLVRRSEQEGTLETATASLLQRSLSFGDKQAADVLTPRVRMETLPQDAPVSAVIELVRRTGHSRFPVTGPGGLDDITGVVHVKQAVAVPREARRTMRIRRVMSPPVLVPSTVSLDPLLDTLQEGGLQLAVVVDEFGGTDGLVTIEDLLEELVGDLVDEHDPAAVPALRGGDEGDEGWTVSGLLRPDEVGQQTGLVLPEGPAYETVGGLVVQELGRIPEVGDTVTVDGVRLTVEAMDRMRVDRLRLDPVEPAETAEPVPDPAGPAPTGERS